MKFAISSICCGSFNSRPITNATSLPFVEAIMQRPKIFCCSSLLITSFLKSIYDRFPAVLLLLLSGTTSLTQLRIFLNTFHVHFLLRITSQVLFPHRHKAFAHTQVSAQRWKLIQAVYPRRLAHNSSQARLSGNI